jgi:hypothetical protein
MESNLWEPLVTTASSRSDAIAVSADGDELERTPYSLTDIPGRKHARHNPTRFPTLQIEVQADPQVSVCPWEAIIPDGLRMATYEDH